MKPVNLLPASQRAARASGDGRRAYVALGLLGLLLVMALACVLTLNQANTRRTGIAEARAAADAAEQRAGALAPFGSFAQIKRTRVASVTALAGGRFDWERLMRELSRVLPDHTWLVDVTASTGPQTEVPGAAGEAQPAATSAEDALSPSVKLTGCSVDQRRVAALMVRLRKLHATEEVSLTESREEEGAGGGGEPSAGIAPGADEGCGPGHFKFDLTVSFVPLPEIAALAGGNVPASLGGGP